MLTSQPPSLRQEGIDNDAVQLPRIDLPIDRITVPTLVLHGTADANVPFAFSEELARSIPGAQFEVIEEADHFMSFSHSDEYYGRVDEFIATLME